MRFFLSVFILIIICSCTNYLDKSIFEPLSIFEIKRGINKDSTFAQLYEGIQKINKDILISDIEKAKYSDLTYKRILDVVYYELDSSQVTSIQKEWYLKYGQIRKKCNIDSICDYWIKYQKDHALEQYVSINFVDFNKQKSSVYKNKLNLYTHFKISPLKGSLERLNAHVEFRQKDETKDDFLLFFSKNNISLRDRISNPNIREISFEVLIFGGSKSKESYTADQIIRSLNIEGITIDDIYMNSKQLTNKIPKSVKYYLENKNPNLNNAHIDNIIYELIDKSYLQEYKYRNDAIEKILRDKDPLVAKYLDLLNK